jgi:transposase
MATKKAAKKTTKKRSTRTARKEARQKATTEERLELLEAEFDTLASDYDELIQFLRQHGINYPGASQEEAPETEGTKE